MNGYTQYIYSVVLFSNPPPLVIFSEIPCGLVQQEVDPGMPMHMV